MATLTFQYGIRLDKDCLEDVSKQIRLARKCYNDMIAVMRDVVAESHEYQMRQAGQEAAALSGHIDSLTAAFKEAKAVQDDDRLKSIAAERRECWRQLSAILKTVRQEHKPILQAIYNRVGTTKETETYQIRCKAVAEGLGWATAQSVLNAAITAWKTSMRLGKAPRFAKGDEKTQDTLSLQFTAKGGLTQDKLFAGASNELGIEALEVGKRKYGRFWFRLGNASAGAYAKGSIQFHRPLPDNASVAMARLVRKRTGYKHDFFLQLVINVPEVRQRVAGRRKPLVAVHFGWNRDDSGRRIFGMTDCAEPGLATVQQLPADIEEDLNRAQAIQGERDKARDSIAPMIRAFDGPLPPEWEEETLDYWKRWKTLPTTHIASSRIHWWAGRLGDFAPDWLSAWCKEDRKHWMDAVRIAQRARNRRKNFYRHIAKGLAMEYEAIAMDTIDLKSAAKKLDEKTGEKTELAKKARAGRVVASLYTLETAIRWAAQKHGTALLDQTGEKTAQTCAICGTTDTLESDESDAQNLHCISCGAELDRKQNGAAVAWQAAMENLEENVTAYWEAELERERNAETAKIARLEKMAAARRVKRELQMQA